MPRCPRCAQPLTFAGVDPQGGSLYACAATLYQYDRARALSFPCMPEGVYFRADGSQVKGQVFAKRDKKGNVILPRTDRADVLVEAPQVGFAREYAAKLATLDDLPKVTVRERDGTLRSFVPTQVRLKARKAIEAWAERHLGFDHRDEQPWRRAPRVAA